MPKNKLTAQEKIDLISELSQWFLDNTESFDRIGIDLAYLYPAIANDTYIEVEEESAFHCLLSNYNFREKRIWEYVHILEK